ncbi:hypothetical protein RUND412_008031 [Rhizina undulata]
MTGVMKSPVVMASIQSAAISTLSNVIAQWLSAKSKDQHFHLELTPVLHWLLFSIITTPPNFHYQIFLEELLPAYILPSKPKKDKHEKEKQRAKTDGNADAPTSETQFSWPNTIKKLALDQLVGGPINTVLYLAIFAGFSGMGAAGVVSHVEEKFVATTLAGLKFWPAVAVTGFVFVPVRYRMVFGMLAGLVWNIALNLTMMA